MKTERLIAGLLLLVQLACLLRDALPAPLSELPTPVALALSALSGALTIVILARAARRSGVGRGWLVLTSISVVLFNLALFWIFTSTDDSIGGGFVILGAGFLLALTAAAIFASYLGSILTFYLGKPTSG